jgi:hypothetical protein
MSRDRKHTWLFTFVDVAFLLLMVFTQFAKMGSADSPVAEMKLPAPSVAKNPELTALSPSKDYRQILVDKHSDKPFVLTRISRGNEISRSPAMSYEELRKGLTIIASEKLKEPRPVVVPLPESYSSDLLQATALVSKFWNLNSSAVVHTTQTDQAQ